MISHSDRSISDNTYLHTVNLGSSINQTNLAKNISNNNNLTVINVSSNHSSMCSINGVIYDVSKSILVKYPEGRSSLNIEPTVTKIGE